MTAIITIGVLAALALGYLLGRIENYNFQNEGEARLYRSIKASFNGPDYHLLNHVTLRTGNETTQIDHILVSRYGIFVIETKHYKGWIIASPKKRKWTQVLYRAKYKFQNPLLQNYKHLRVVQELLDFLPSTVIQQAVVFTGDAEFKSEIPDGVFTLLDFLEYVADHNEAVMSPNRVQFCVGRLEKLRLELSQKTDVEHVQHLRRKYCIDD